MVCGNSVEPDIIEYSESLSGITPMDEEAVLAVASERIGLEKLYRLTTGTLLGIRPWVGGSRGEGGV